MAEETTPSRSKGKRSRCENRFNFSFSDDDFEELTKGHCPHNTNSSTKWSLSNFSEWIDARCKEESGFSLTADILLTDNKEKLCECLCKYVVETRKEDGTHYPPRTIQILLMGLQRHIRSAKVGFAINFMTDTEFTKLRNVCDTYYRQLHSKGVGTSVNRTKPLSPEDEDQLWVTGVLNPNTPEGLLNCVFFYNGKNFCLRGGQEHRDMKFSQLKREVVKIGHDPKVCYVYTEYGSKNRSGGLKQLKIENKVVRQFESPGERCHVTFLDTYMLKVPKSALEKDNFYLRPLAKAPDDPIAPWFTEVPLGRNTLANMMKTMSKKANLTTEYTNHSLRAFGATEMFKHGIEEKIIQQRTGHRSTEALRKYEATTMEQELSVSKLLQGSCVNRSPLSSVANLPHTSRISPAFQGCSFQGCTINIIQQPEFDPEEQLCGVDVNDFINF